MKFSLKKKTTLLVVSIALLIGLAALIIFWWGIKSVIMTHYSNKSIELTKTIATTIDSAKVGHIHDAVMDIYNKTENRVKSDQWGTEAFNNYISLYSDIEKSDDFQ